jgi:hypothetical protein
MSIEYPNDADGDALRRVASHGSDIVPSKSSLLPNRVTHATLPWGEPYTVPGIGRSTASRAEEIVKSEVKLAELAAVVSGADRDNSLAGTGTNC